MTQQKQIYFYKFTVCLSQMVIYEIVGNQCCVCLQFVFEF